MISNNVSFSGTATISKNLQNFLGPKETAAIRKEIKRIVPDVRVEMHGSACSPIKGISYTFLDAVNTDWMDGKGIRTKNKVKFQDTAHIVDDKNPKMTGERILKVVGAFKENLSKGLTSFIGN